MHFGTTGKWHMLIGQSPAVSHPTSVKSNNDKQMLAKGNEMLCKT
jgi:hypothetical protein